MKVMLVMPTESGTWLREWDLPFPPFPHLGIRLDTYEVFNIEDVVVDQPTHRFPVACIGHLDGSETTPTDDNKCVSLGFEKGVYV